MDDDHPRHHKHKGKRKSNLKVWAILVVIAIIVIAVLVYAFGGSVPNITTSSTTAVSTKGTVVSVEGTRYLLSLSRYNPLLKTAYIHVTELPAFINPTLNVTLPLNSSVKINYEETYANMQFAMRSVNNSSATIVITPLSQSLQVAPDSEYINQISYGLLGTGTVTTNATTTVATTTISASGTTTAATTTIQVNTTNATVIDIKDALVGDGFYGLMLNFTKLYANITQCTPELYNTTYSRVYGQLPSGPGTYYNATNETPYSLVQKNVSEGSGNYAVEFIALSRDPVLNNSIAAQINVSTSTKLVTSQGAGSGSIFSGESNSDIISSYQQSTSVGNACGVMVG